MLLRSPTCWSGRYSSDADLEMQLQEPSIRAPVWFLFPYSWLDTVSTLVCRVQEYHNITCMREEKKGKNSVEGGRGRGRKVEIPSAWCQIAGVRTCCPSAGRTCMKSGLAQSCRDLTLLYLLPKCYSMSWKNSLQFMGKSLY